MKIYTPEEVWKCCMPLLIRRTLVQEMSLIGAEFRTYHCLLFLATPVGPKILIRNVKKNY